MEQKTYRTFHFENPLRANFSHGLIMLYLGGRVGVPHSFRAVYRRSFRRYIRGIRN